MKSAERVVTNTGYLYVRMLISVVLSLYATRLILGALGEVDYGVFALVGGVIGMLSFLNSAMAVSTQRYLSFFLGAGEKNKLEAIFRVSIILHLIIGLFVVILLEIGGFFLFNGFLNIPPDRVHAAKMVYHFMVISTFFTINAVPYDAAINSHENMFFIALTGILESLLKLGIAFWLLYTGTDKLILYGLLYAVLTITIRVIKSVFCSLRYEECHINFPLRLDMDLLKEMSSFAGWNLFGSACSVVKGQGVPIILNLFFGVVVNAAYGIANQINWQLVSFSANLIKALNPQIAKSEGGGDRQRMLRLAMLASKSSFFLISFFAVSLIMEMPYVLKIWLKDVPDYTIVFSRLVLVVSLFEQMTVGLMRAVQSVGKIKAYQIVIGTILIMNLPFAYLLLKIGLPPAAVLIGSVFLEIIAGATRIVFAKYLTGLKPGDYLLHVVFRPFIVIFISGVLTYSVQLFMPEGFLRLLLSIVISVFSMLLLIPAIALSEYEREKISEVFISYRKRLKIFD